MARRLGRNEAHSGRGPTDAPRHRDLERRRELEARVYGGAEVSPADVDELRRLLGVPSRGRGVTADRRSISALDPAGRDVDDDAPSTGDDGSGTSDGADSADESRPARPALAWLAGGVAAVVLAGVVGAGVTVALLGRGADGRPASESTAIGTPASTVGLGPAAEAESLGEQYFDQKQTAGDRPTVAMPGIDKASTRRVLAQFGQSDGEASVWVARGTNHSFCLIMAVGSTRAASSCTPEQDVISSGVRLDMATSDDGTISATWNLATGLLQLTPFPAGAVGTRGGGRSTP